MDTSNESLATQHLPLFGVKGLDCAYQFTKIGTLHCRSLQ